MDANMVVLCGSKKGILIFAAMAISNQQLLQCVSQFGTPLYVYDAHTINKKVEEIKQAFNSHQYHFFYACKALTNIHILKHIKEIGLNIDCSSVNEVELALYVGFSPHQILYTSNGIHINEIIRAKELGVNVNIDSLSNLRKFGEKFGNSYPIGLRLRPNIMAGGNLKISTGHDKSKFGIPIDQLSEILEIVEHYHINIAGLHIHTGSEIKDVAVWVNVIKVLFTIIPHFKQLTYLDLGGGFKVPYKKEEIGTDIVELATSIKELLGSNILTRDLQVWFEPGKYLVSECGFFLTQVNVLKQTSSLQFVGVDTGFNHLIRPMLYGSYHEIENISNPNDDKEVYTVVGNICETDTFASDREIAKISEGDILCFYNAGAYAFEMSSNYNSRYKPAEVLYKENKFKLIRERQTFKDLLNNQTPL